MGRAAAIELVRSRFYRFQPTLSITEIEQRLVDLGDVVCRCEDPRHTVGMLEGGEAKSIITRLRLREFIEWLGGLGKAKQLKQTPNNYSTVILVSFH